MKKIISLFILMFIMLFVTSCKNNVSEKNEVTKEDVLLFLENKRIGFEDNSVSFTIKYDNMHGEKGGSSNYLLEEEYKLRGSITEQGYGNFTYKSKRQFKKNDNNERLSKKIKEEGTVFLRTNSSKNEYYFKIISKDVKNIFFTKREIIKTSSIHSSSMYSQIENDCKTIRSLFNLVLNDYDEYDTFYYIDDNKLKFVRRDVGSYYEYIYIFNEDKLERFVFTSHTYFGGSKKEITFKDIYEITAPLDAEDYE